MCEKCDEVKRLVEEWANKQGHDRCWYYPDIFRQIADTLGVNLNIEPAMPPRPEFEEGCRRYQEEEYHHGRT